MKKLLRISLISLIVSTVVYFGAAVIMIFWPEKTFAVDPFPVASYKVVDAGLNHYSTRDGETLLARHYLADSPDTILFLHGVTSHSAALSGSALTLQEAIGAEVITLDLRGHGQSGGRPGHVEYIGQYEDDVADVITAIRAERPDGRLILAGHSMGGGIALRFAQLTDRPSVDAYLMFAPHLGTDAPTIPKQDPDAAAAAALYSRLIAPGPRCRPIGCRRPDGGGGGQSGRGICGVGV